MIVLLRITPLLVCLALLIRRHGLHPIVLPIPHYIRRVNRETHGSAGKTGKLTMVLQAHPLRLVSARQKHLERTSMELLLQTSWSHVLRKERILGTRGRTGPERYSNHSTTQGNIFLRIMNYILGSRSFDECYKSRFCNPLLVLLIKATQCVPVYRPSHLISEYLQLLDSYSEPYKSL
jgi:hypothetical protein